MKLMNEEGLIIEKLQAGIDDIDIPSDHEIHIEFEKRMELMVKAYTESEMAKQLEMSLDTDIQIKETLISWMD